MQIFQENAKGLQLVFPKELSDDMGEALSIEGRLVATPIPSGQRPLVNRGETATLEEWSSQPKPEAGLFSPSQH